MDGNEERDGGRRRAFDDLLLRDIATMVFGSLAYIGDRLGLFRVLAESGPVTSDGFASLVGCHPRYTREWLSAMAAASWIEYDPQTDRFVLPPEHVPYLVDEEHPLYVGGMLEAVVPLAQIVPDVMDCFRYGGGVDYAAHHPDMPGISDRLRAPHLRNYLTQVWLPNLLPEVHRRAMEGSVVAEVGCGIGRALEAMARAYPNSRFTGFEPDERAARQARALMAQVGVADQVKIVNGGTEAMAGKAFDLVTTFHAIPSFAQPQAALQRIGASLSAGGTYLMLEARVSDRLEEMLHPVGQFLYSFSSLYTLPISLAHGGTGSGICIGEETLARMCSQSGFGQFGRLEFDHPLIALYAARR